MSKKDLDDEDLDKELEKQWKIQQREKDKCGKALPENRETGVQRTNVKVKKKE
jgi:hypothetical protein